jgi:hypothetical protein
MTEHPAVARRWQFAAYVSGVLAIAGLSVGVFGAIGAAEDRDRVASCRTITAELAELFDQQRDLTIDVTIEGVSDRVLSVQRSLTDKFDAVGECG